ncbi:MAG: TonB family protein [Tannerella sp.]|jgi:TonB family protein|nr:TonB family protein [Tannerella sp.]
MKLDKNDITALIVTVIVHILIFLYLYFGILKTIMPVRDDGIFVNFGDELAGAGFFEPQQSASSRIEQAIPPIPRDPKPNNDKNNLITQDQEETVHIPENKKEKVAETREQPKENRKTDEELRREAEQRKIEEQKKQASAIDSRASNAFGNNQGASSGNSGSAGNQSSAGFAENSVKNAMSQGDASSGTGNQGSPFGNSDSGANVGVGGFGSFSLSGRTLREGGLQRPNYSAQVEGKIVINITVDNYGNVISATINPKGTNIEDLSMRNSAIQAARGAKFNRIQSADNQMGTITYIYKFTN